MHNSAEQIRQRRIHTAKTSLEESNTIKQDKIVEWALLDIAEQLHGILYHMQHNMQLRGPQGS